ncbi:hypothetical protein HMPREF1531_01990 [Propionibacterium sp. oral taxon 192 str. F0372]|uniref:hypothetical protein n=1 Tax=Propionibacterium sp. oral taxon 192 TaxID=671222 RepID=UPI00035417EC|nr:hypothetical protein [Propionibacterium sp. oral taxon 192]EPH02679.1 hypothetical protein HMPREF1531_01990 [Propionibacterium sp. oral taxon 192 str. F0372]
MTQDVTTVSWTAAAVAGPLVAGAGCIAWIVAGTETAVSVLVGGAAVLAFFASGVLVQRLCMAMGDARGLLLNVAGYLLRLCVLWAVGTALATHPIIGQNASPTLLGVGALVGVSGWVAGMLFGHSREKIPVYDPQYTAPKPKGWES